MAADPNSADLDDAAASLARSLESCRNLVANYRAMLNDSSNDNPVDDLSGDDSEVG